MGATELTVGPSGLACLRPTSTPRTLCGRRSIVCGVAAASAAAPVVTAAFVISRTVANFGVCRVVKETGLVKIKVDPSTVRDIAASIIKF